MTYKLNILDSVKIIKYTSVEETGINVFNNFACNRSKRDPYSYYAYKENYNYQSKNLIGKIITTITVYKAGEKAQIKINGWTFPSTFTEIFEVHMRWSDCSIHFNCTSPSGHTIRVLINWGHRDTMDRIIKAISYIINIDGRVPSSISFVKDDVIVGY